MLHRAFKLAAAAVFVACLFQAAAARALDDPATAKKKYDAYKVRVIGGDLSVDWRDFRLSAMVAGVDGSFSWKDARQSTRCAEQG
jgi:hypothetical protein